MKIVYLSRSSFPTRAANAVQVMQMCQAFWRIGHEVTLIGHVRTKNIPELFSHYDIEIPFSICPMPSMNNTATDPLYITTGVLRAYTLSPDLAYGRSLEMCFGTAFLGIPTIYEAHSLPRTAGKRLLMRSLTRLPAFVRLVTISNGLAKAFIEQGLIPAHTPHDKRLCVAHDGANEHVAGETHTSPDDIRMTLLREGVSVPPQALDRGTLHVGYIGSLYEGKGMEIILPLARLCPWATFHIVGGSPEEVAQWKYRAVDAQGTPLPSMHFYGFVPHRLTALFRSLFDVALIPSQPRIRNVSGNIDEGEHVSPLKVFEYMASGLPILASDIGALREILQHRETALLIAPHDPLQWRDALAFLRDHPEERRRLGDSARERFLRHFSWQSRAARVLEGVGSSYAAPTT